MFSKILKIKSIDFIINQNVQSETYAEKMSVQDSTMFWSQLYMFIYANPPVIKFNATPIVELVLS